MNMNSSNETNLSQEASPSSDSFDDALKENETFKTVGNTNINKTQTVSECHDKGNTNGPSEPQKGNLSITTTSLLETNSKEDFSPKKEHDKKVNGNESLQQKVVENINETQTIPEKHDEKEALLKESNKYKSPAENAQKVQPSKDSLPEQSSDNSGDMETAENTLYNNSLDSNLNKKESLQEKVVGNLRTNETQASLEFSDEFVGYSKKLDRTEIFQESQNVNGDQLTKNAKSEFNKHSLDNHTSRETSVLLSPERLGSSSSLTRRRPISSQQTDDVLSATIVIDEEIERLSNVPHYKRRKVFNIIKHVISIVLIVLDVIFDWIEYDEMNSRGTYEIAEERQVNNIKITYKCEETGETIQLVYMIFTIIGTLISVGQICNIVYQIVHERKNKFIEKRLVHEYIETFVLLFFIKISQLLLIMGFFDVCTLDCTIDGTEILISLNIALSFSRISWRWFTSCKCCTIYLKTPPKRRPSTRTSIVSQQLSRTPGASSLRSQQLTHTPSFTSIISQQGAHTPSVTSIRSQQWARPPSVTSIRSQQWARPSSGTSIRSQQWARTPSVTSIRSQQWAHTPSVISKRNQRSSRSPIRRHSHEQRGCCSDINCFLVVIFFPLILPFLPFIIIYKLFKRFSCPCDACSKRVQASEVEREKFKCERSCKCCIMRCFPSRFEEPDTDACDCTCKTCLACEQSFKCFLCRCFPTHLPNETDGVVECLCGQCLTCEQNCRCCILRCFPSYQQPSVDDFCTCKCGECMACEIPCKCFILRCCPTHMNPPKSEILTCRCGECMSCEIPCKCFTFRCCPTHLSPPKSEILTCRCGECMASEIPCKCFTFRCCPTYLSPPKSEILTCRCGECMASEIPCKCFTFRCCPTHLSPPKSEILTCRCGECMASEIPCKCFTLRCCPTHLSPPKSEILTCRCGECMACEIPFKCFTFRCCPTHLSSPKTGIWTCSCRECLACALPCKCFIFRCFPEFLKNPHPDICTCLCSQCLSCALPCPCCVCRCFPEHQGETDWFNCTCGKCFACEKSCCCCVCRICPSELDPPKQDIFQCLCKDICTCCKSTAVAPRPIPISTITTQPRLPVPPPPPYQQIIQKLVQPRPRPVVIQPQPLPPPRLPTPPTRLPTPKPPRQKCSCKKCLECLSKCQYFFIAVCLLFLILLYLFYLCLIGIQLQYVLVCTVNETVMETTQVILVRNFVSLF